MEIVGNDENAIKSAVMNATLNPLSNLANLLGWGWAGGCNCYVGQGMDRTDNGWQAHFDGCGGYMSDIRLGIDYDDWGFNLTNIIWEPPTQTELTPLEIDGGLLDNWESSTPLDSSYTIKTSKTSTVTDTKTSTFNFQSETSFTVDYKPPSVSGGVGGSFTQKLVFGRTNTEGHSESTTNSVETTFSIKKVIPAYSRQKWSAVMARTKSSAAYTAIIVPRFSIRLKGFLKWGSDDPNSQDTNYHQNYAGRGDRPRTDDQPWAKFGDSHISFADDLRNKFANRITPWQWERLVNQHPEAQYYIDQLTNTSNYQFTITGIVDNVEGTKVDSKYEAEEYNPAHPQPAHTQFWAVNPHSSKTKTAIHVPRFLNSSMHV